MLVDGGWFDKRKKFLVDFVILGELLNFCQMTLIREVFKNSSSID